MSAWGGSWGSSWGNSWGVVTPEDNQSGDGRLTSIRGNRVSAIQNDDRITTTQEQNRVAETSSNLRLVSVNGQRVTEAPNDTRIIVVED